jgi:hypothetical protein
VQSVLGAMRTTKRHDWDHVTRKQACYRCERCRHRFSVTYANALFGIREKLDLAVMCFWNFAHGAPLALTCRQLGAKEDIVRRFYKTARAVCAWDSQRRQKAFVYGHRYPFTTIMEVDESRFGKWKTEEAGVVVYYHWVLQGCVVRGDMTSLSLWEYGVTRSEVVGRVEPAQKERWLAKCHELFDSNSHIVLMSDGAHCYKAKHEGIVQHFSVNHSEHEWTRPETVLMNLGTQESKLSLAGTQLLDSLWGKLKDGIPTGLRVDTPEARCCKLEYVQAALWRIIIGSADPWQTFCEAAKGWRSEKALATAKLLSCLSLMNKAPPRGAESAGGGGDAMKESAASAEDEKDLNEIMAQMNTSEVQNLEKACQARRLALQDSAPPQLEPAPPRREPAPHQLEPAPPSLEPAPRQLEQCILCTPTWTCALHDLGDRGDVPLEVHDRMEELARRGGIPCSTPGQRRRHRGTSGSEYGVPPALREALRLGYLSPNLPAPIGLCWKVRGGKWALVPNGG